MRLVFISTPRTLCRRTTLNDAIVLLARWSKDRNRHLNRNSTPPRPPLPLLPYSRWTQDHPYLRVTVRPPEIRQNQLLTIDYNAMELDMSSPFDCRCGADNCRGRVSGFANLPPAAQKEYTTSAPAASVAGKRPEGPPPLIGAVRAWAKEANLPGAR